MTLAEVAVAVDGRLHGIADAIVAVGDVVVDSRLVTPGAVFVALPGTTTDGRLFVDEAVRRGAVAAVVSSPFDGPAIVVDETLSALGALAATTLQRLPHLRVVGITGSNGKTTTKDLVASVLATKASTVAAPASYNGEVGLPLSVFRVDDETRYLVLEYGARGLGHIRELTGIARPDIGVVLGVGVAHIGEFGSREMIARAKAELVEALPADGLAVLNVDDAAVIAMREQTPARVRTFGRSLAADVAATDITVDATGRSRFTLCVGDERSDVALQLYGDHQVTNALAAACVAIECGLSVNDASAALSLAAASSRWRMEVTETPDGVTVVNDAYNANPDSMAAGLRALVAIAAGRPTWAVLGHMAELGAETGPAHETVGRLVAELGIDNLVAVGELAAGIAAAAEQGGTSVQRAADVDDAVACLREHLTSGAVVLVKASRSAGLERVAHALTAGVVAA